MGCRCRRTAAPLLSTIGCSLSSRFSRSNARDLPPAGRCPPARPAQPSTRSGRSGRRAAGTPGTTWRTPAVSGRSGRSGAFPGRHDLVGAAQGPVEVASQDQRCDLHTGRDVGGRTVRPARRQSPDRRQRGWVVAGEHRVHASAEVDVADLGRPRGCVASSRSSCCTRRSSRCCNCSRVGRFTAASGTAWAYLTLAGCGAQPLQPVN
jgi:hypothetical protein